MDYKGLSVLVLTMALFATTQGDKCTKAEEAEVKESHLQCTKQVESRYTFDQIQNDPFARPLNLEFDSNGRPQLPPPSAVDDPRRQQREDQMCAMLEEVVNNCGDLYKKCLNDQEMRTFKDTQLEIFVQIMSNLYNLGAAVMECPVVVEYKRSGRSGDLMVSATQNCDDKEVGALNTEYQGCLVKVNTEMTTQMQVNIKNWDRLFKTLCDGIEKVVHGCGNLLRRCYTEEEIEETKIGQLELTRQVFSDLLGDEVSDEDENDVNSGGPGGLSGLNVRRCPAYKSIAAAQVGKAPQSVPSSTFAIFFAAVLALVLA